MVCSTCNQELHIKQLCISQIISEGSAQLMTSICRRGPKLPYWKLSKFVMHITYVIFYHYTQYYIRGIILCVHAKVNDAVIWF